MGCTVGSNKPFSTLNLRIKPGEGPIPEPAGICMLRIKKLPRRAQPGGGKPISGDHKTDESNPPSTDPQKRGPHRTTENATGRVGGGTNGQAKWQQMGGGESGRGRGRALVTSLAH